MSGKSETLVRFHEKLGDKPVTLTSWRRRNDGQRLRTLRFVKPLQSAIGPKQCTNIEKLSVEYINKDGFVVLASCSSQGVPFSNNFQNYVQWVASPVHGNPQSTVLHVTGECKFHTPIWGPLKGTISNESIKGMKKAYSTLQTMVQDRFGVPLHNTTKLAAVANSKIDGTSNSVVSYLQSSQSNPAVMLVVMAMCIVLWRMALLDTLALTVLRRIAAATTK